MMKKSIAAGLLMVMMVWAEIALAPMLIMNLWHGQAAQAMSEQMNAHLHVMPAGHPCCPRIGEPIPNKEDLAGFEFATTSLPCQDEHRCCFQSGPVNVPAPVSAARRYSRAIIPATAELSVPATSNEVHATAVAPGPPPGLAGMLLRV
jgi:hypothetical protein